MNSPLVTVFVPTQLEQNKPYLDLCLTALSKTKEVEFELFLVSGTKEVASDYLRYRKLIPGSTIIYNQNLVGFSAKLQHVYKKFSYKSKYVLLLSDDVMVSEYMIADMAKAFEDREMIMNPMSNSDCKSMYDADIYLTRYDERLQKEYMKVYPDMYVDDITKKWEHSIYHYPRKNKCLVPFPSLSFFCTMIPISVFNKVGHLDPELEFRHNDEDYCLRAKQQGIGMAVNFGAFAFHFGSKTIKSMANAQMQMKCTEYFRNKWKV